MGLTSIVKKSYNAFSRELSVMCLQLFSNKDEFEYLECKHGGYFLRGRLVDAEPVGDVECIEYFTDDSLEMAVRGKMIALEHGYMKGVNAVVILKEKTMHYDDGILSYIQPMKMYHKFRRNTDKVPMALEKQAMNYAFTYVN